MSKNTMLGALCHYITHANAQDFQPMKANLGLLAELGADINIKGRRMRAIAYAERSAAEIQAFLVGRNAN
jgi:methylenetetrahydrofolate--tRNA-(uracil-5-)-methyltransferase